jgi:hypothetical protein
MLLTTASLVVLQVVTGVTLFNASHPLVSGGVNSNTQAVATDLNETALENAVISNRSMDR